MCVVAEGAGIPLAVALTGGNRHDVTQLLPLIDKVPPVRGRRGRPRRRPDELYADRAYDHDKYRKAVRGKGIRPRIARRGQPHRAPDWAPSGGVVERTIAWYHGMKRLRIRWERRDDALTTSERRTIRRILLPACGAHGGGSPHSGRVAKAKTMSLSVVSRLIFMWSNVSPGRSSFPSDRRAFHRRALELGSLGLDQLTAALEGDRSPLVHGGKTSRGPHL
ncbi:hypothetical protein GCM10023176_34470 [Micromonospora coerulea]|uniref:Transposase IS4-like domain-containing protein n=1 Tax=Micromonospora coerulea TaxID=47856 RepID=A0ABP8SPW6_9ACTN